MAAGFASHLQLFSLSATSPGASLLRAVSELYENAQDATSKNVHGGRIDVSVEGLDDCRLRVRVTDDGHGFSAQDLHRITDLFASSKGIIAAPHAGEGGTALGDLGSDR